MAGLVNRGTGAGGANTNASGLPFEEKTSLMERLLNAGFVKKTIDSTTNGWYLEKAIDDNKTIIYTRQIGLHKYAKKHLGKSPSRRPDEAFLLKTGDTYTLRILEKKNQNVAGSVTEKLYTGDFLRKLYEKELGIQTEYAYCISQFLKTIYMSSNWNNQRDIMKDANIRVFFGDDEDYFTQIETWIYS